MADITLRVLTRWDDIAAFGRDRWDALLPARPHRNFFMSHDRLACWSKHDQHCRQPLVLVFEEGDRAIGLLPLSLCSMRRSGVTVRTLELLGGRTMEYATIPLPEGREDLARLAMDHLLSLRSAWDLMWLEEVDSEDPGLRLLTEEASRRSLAQEYVVSALAPYLPLDRPFDALWADLFDSKGRNARTRKMRAALNTPGLEVHRLTPETDLGQLLGEVAELERTSWKGQKNVGLFSEETGSWNTELIREFVAKGMVDLRWVTIEGRMVSYRVGFIWDGVYNDYNTAYDPEYGKLSLSSVLLHQTIQDLCDWGVKRMEFCRGIYRYKLEWATGVRENRLVRIYNRTARAKTLRLLAWGKRSLRGGRTAARPELPIPLKDPLPPYTG